MSSGDSVANDLNSIMEENARTLVGICGQVKQGDRVLLVSDDTTESIAPYLLSAARNASDSVKHVTMAPTSMHGIEPPQHVAEAMLDADVILGLTKSSMAHTQARLNATNRGARYLSLADYNAEQLARPSVGVDYFKWAEYAKKVKMILDGAKRIEVTTEIGTNLTMDASSRVANCCPGICYTKGSMGSPPDIETNVSPIEELSHGTLVVDGSIPCKEIGLLKQPIAVMFRNGSIYEIDTSSEQGRALEQLFDLNNHPKRGVLAEFGIGMNPKAELCGLMLEDEGCYGTIHIGVGSNYTVGGKNKVDFHLDHLVRYPTVHVNGQLLMERGILVLDGKHILRD
jgi:leucyl aminopeptidase (aminopeptidase T)